MGAPFTADGNTIQASYEHVRRVAEFNGVPYAGWNEITGGGIAREGQNYVRGAGDEPRGVTDGIVTPQDITVKVEGYTWQNLKNALLIQALENGDTSATAHQKVAWKLVDQWRGADATQPSITITYSVKVKSEVPETPNDGNQFYYTLTLVQTGVPQEEFGT